MSESEPSDEVTKRQVVVET